MTGYVYGADGTRVAKGSITSWSCDPNVNGFTTSSDYILGPSNQQFTELRASSTPNVMIWHHTNIWLGGNLLGTYDEFGTHFYFDDPLGTRRAQTDSQGVLEQTCQSLPYGDGETCAPTPTEHLFTGKERDTESGNDYFGARYYGSNMGRFMSPDYSDDDDGPVSIPYYNPSNPQSLNLYSYVHNNPLVNTDPDGHDCIYADGNGGGYVQRGDCTNAGGKDDNGVYVDGTIDVNSFKYNASNNSSSFSFTPNDAPSGAIGTGVLQGPNLSNGPTDGDAYFAAASMIGNGGMAAIKDFTIGSVVGGAIGGAVLASGAGAAALTTLGDLGSGVTEHAEEAKLLARHGITPAQARAAIEAAKKSGDVVEAMGRYGPQLRYTANGIRVVVATTGRNAGKIITAFFK